MKYLCSGRGLFLCVLVAAIFVSCNQKNDKNQKKIEAWVTSLDKQHLLEKQDLSVNTNKKVDGTISIESSQTYQEIDGFGYTLTGGSALHLNKMSAAARADLLQELFGTDNGEIGISYLRLSIGASDLDEAPFSYNDLPEEETDEKLEKFSLANDTVNLIPVLKEILEVAPEIKILGSPWSPPVWMKDNGDTRGGSLKEEYFEVYANYFVKYIESMEAEGITIDAITIQNEPLHPGNNPSLLMKADTQKKFIKNNLGPVFEKNNIKTKIVLYDHNADRPDYPISILDDPEAAKYVDGSAFHLYGGEIEALSEVHEAYPNKNIYFTEQWVGAPGNFAKEMEWHTENLIIGATRNWSRIVLEWNLAADENQQPHTDRGGCDRCLGAITISGDSVIREPAYYIIAQASKFVRPGSIRVASNKVDDFPNVAFKTPKEDIVLILQNKAKKAKNLKIEIEDKSHIVQLPAETVATLKF